MITQTIDKIQLFLRKYLDYKSVNKEVTVDQLKVDSNGRYFLIVENNPHQTNQYICRVYSITDANGNEYAIPNNPDEVTDWRPQISIGNNKTIGVVMPGNSDIVNQGVPPFTVRYQVSGMYDKILHGIPDEVTNFGISINLGLATKNSRYIGNEETRREVSGIQDVTEPMYVKYKEIYDGSIIFYIWANSGLERNILLDSFLKIVNGKKDELDKIANIDINTISGESEENFGKKYLYLVKADFNGLLNEYIENYSDNSSITYVKTDLNVFSGNLIDVKSRLSGQEFKTEVIEIQENYEDVYLIEGYIESVKVQADKLYTYQTLQYTEDYTTFNEHQIVISLENVLETYNEDRILRVEYMDKEMEYQLNGTDLYVFIERSEITTLDFSKYLYVEYINREFQNNYDLDLDRNVITIHGDNIYKAYVEVSYLQPNITIENNNMYETIDIEL